MKAAFYTLGCKVNQYETQALSEQFRSKGFQIVTPEEEADVYLVNSCTVTGTGDQKSRQAVRRFKRLHPNSIVVLTGCMPQAYPSQANILSQADIVIGNRDSEKILDAIDEYQLSGKRIFQVAPHETGETSHGGSISGFQEHTRAFVKIQDGCDRFCSYCIIPTSRGRVRSKPLGELEEELKRLQAAGFLEIVLVGINLSSYGKDLSVSFCGAVERACSVDGILRVRLGSLEPDHLTPEVVKRLANCEKLCPQFHLSLQSGCDETLRRMNRHYTCAEYEALCGSLRQYFPDAAITTDVMTGFPGETEEEFAASLSFVRKIGFEKIHVFPYSSRPGTKAASMPQLPKAVKEERARRMRAAADEMRKSFLTGEIGKCFPVLFETRGTNGFLEGYTPNYTPVRVRALQELCGSICDVRLIAASGDGCIGELTGL